jgi:hypothetical protein
VIAGFTVPSEIRQPFSGKIPHFSFAIFAILAFFAVKKS